MSHDSNTRSQQELVEVAFFLEAILGASKDEFEVLESSEQSLFTAVSSTDLSAVNETGRVMEVATIGLAVMSSAFAVASALNTVQSGTYVGTEPHEKIQALSGFVFLTVEAAILQAFTSDHFTMKDMRRLWSL